MHSRELKHAIATSANGYNKRKTVAAVLRDLFPEEKANVNMLLIAYDCGLVELIESKTIDRQKAIDIIHEIVDDYAMSDEKAEWAVKTWLEAYDLHLFDPGKSVWKRFGGTEDDGYINCIHCGNKVYKKAEYCPFCGVSLKEIHFENISNCGKFTQYLASLGSDELTDLTRRTYFSIKGNSKLTPHLSGDESVSFSILLILLGYLKNIEKKQDQRLLQLICMVIASMFYGFPGKLLRTRSDLIVKSEAGIDAADLSTAYDYMKSRMLDSLKGMEFFQDSSRDELHEVMQSFRDGFTQIGVEGLNFDPYGVQIDAINKALSQIYITGQKTAQVTLVDALASFSKAQNALFGIYDSSNPDRAFIESMEDVISIMEKANTSLVQLIKYLKKQVIMRCGCETKPEDIWDDQAHPKSILPPYIDLAKQHCEVCESRENMPFIGERFKKVKECFGRCSDLLAEIIRISE